MGRPTKLTPEVQADLVQAIRLGATRELACDYVGISTTTLYRWLQQGDVAEDGPYREFRDAIKKAEGRGAVEALARIQTAAKDGSWQAAAWLLERRHGYRRPASTMDRVVVVDSRQLVGVDPPVDASENLVAVDDPSDVTELEHRFRRRLHAAPPCRTQVSNRLA